jgi:hypothetical protein
MDTKQAIAYLAQLANDFARGLPPSAAPLVIQQAQAAIKSIEDALKQVSNGA